MVRPATIPVKVWVPTGRWRTKPRCVQSQCVTSRSSSSSSPSDGTSVPLPKTVADPAELKEAVGGVPRDVVNRLGPTVLVHENPVVSGPHRIERDLQAMAVGCHIPLARRTTQILHRALLSCRSEL